MRKLFYYPQQSNLGYPALLICLDFYISKLMVLFEVNTVLGHLYRFYKSASWHGVGGVFTSSFYSITSYILYSMLIYISVSDASSQNEIIRLIYILTWYFLPRRLYERAHPDDIKKPLSPVIEKVMQVYVFFCQTLSVYLLVDPFLLLVVWFNTTDYSDWEPLPRPQQFVNQEQEHHRSVL